MYEIEQHSKAGCGIYVQMHSVRKKWYSLQYFGIYFVQNLFIQNLFI